MSTCTHLIRSVSVETVMAERQEAITAFTNAMVLMKEAQSKISRLMRQDSAHALSDCFYSALIVAADPEKCGKSIARKMDVKIWKHLMDETGMFSIMSQKQRDQWKTRYIATTCRWLRGKTLPPLSAGFIRIEIPFSARGSRMFSVRCRGITRPITR